MRPNGALATNILEHARTLERENANLREIIHLMSQQFIEALKRVDALNILPKHVDKTLQRPQ